MSLIATYRRARSDHSLRRDSDVMGLTVCIALLVALTAGHDHTPHSKLDVLLIVWGTTVGLALTHWFAMLVAARLVEDRDLPARPLELLISQTVMAIAVATTASITVLITSDRFDRLGARVVSALFIGGIVTYETRRSSMSLRQRLVLSGTVSVAGVAIALTKWYIS